MPTAVRCEQEHWFADFTCGTELRTVDLTAEAVDRVLTGYKAVLPTDEASAMLVFMQWRWRYYLRNNLRNRARKKDDYL